ncbi:hypothetical protein ABPG73_017327 [Tetrahymena malaccensis]
MKRLNMIIINLEWLMGKSNLHHENSTLGFGVLVCHLLSCLIFHNQSQLSLQQYSISVHLLRIVAQASGSSYQAKSYQGYCQGQNAFKKENARWTSYEMGDCQKDDKSAPLQIFIYFLEFQIQFLIEFFIVIRTSQYVTKYDQLACLQQIFSLVIQISNEETFLTRKGLFLFKKAVTCNLEEIKNDICKRKKEHSQSEQLLFILCFSH